MPELDTLKYDNLFAGDGVDVVTEEIEIAASQTIKRGDILVRAAGKFSRPAGVIADATFLVDHLVAGNIVRIASEDVTTAAGVTAKSIGYATGEFNENAMRFGGASTADDNRDALAARSIFLKKSQKQ